MLDSLKVAHVKLLLRGRKHSHRAIAQLTGVSRASVGNIAHGRWCGDRRKPSAEQPESVGPARRCPGCGGMVQFPCRTCETRGTLKLVGLAVRRSRLRDCPGQLFLELKPAHQVRYEEVRAARQARVAKGEGRAPDEAAGVPQEPWWLDDAEDLVEPDEAA